MKNMAKRVASFVFAAVMCASFFNSGEALRVKALETKTYDVSFENSTYNASATGIDFGRAGDQWKRAQSFMASDGGDIQSVDVKIMKIGAPGNLVAQLYATDALGGIKGEALASAEVGADSISSGGLAEQSIPLVYSGLVKGKLYALMLSQTTTAGWYGWYCSNDASNPDWWHSDVYNPQIKQPGYSGELASYKITDGDEIVDDSRCGDLWLKVNYTEGGGGVTDPDTDKPAESLEALYNEDIQNGGSSFFMDRVLARPGVDPSLKEDSGIMTRGRALYTKGTNDSGLVKEFGFGGVMRYVKGDRPGYTIKVNNQPASSFKEDVSRRTDYPSYWTSAYQGTSGANSGIFVEHRRFITENNTAVTILDIKNNGSEPKDVSLVMNAPGCNTADKNALCGKLRVDYRNLALKASMDGGQVVSGAIKRTVAVNAGETVSIKAQMGFIDPKGGATSAEFEIYSGYTGEQAFKTQLKTYNKWWVENIPYMWVSDPVMQKMIAYRWWITRNNTVDAGTVNYPFPTSMEGVFGYNNAIVNAVPWQMDELRYLRSPKLEYGTWADAVFAAKGGIFRDNPAGVWGVKPQHYISKAGWESYKVHGGQPDFLKAMAKAGAGDVDATKKEFAFDDSNLYGVQYDAWDDDTASLAVSGEQQRIDTASLAWCNANAVSEMYGACGEKAKAQQYKTLADNIKKDNLANSWDSSSEQFLMKMADTGEFNQFRDINNYYGFMVGMIPTGGGYDRALRFFGDESEFPMWPMYVSNSSDYNTIQNDSRYKNRSRNYSPGNIAITLKMFASAIKNYDVPNITGQDFRNLLDNYTKMCFANKNFNFPDANEFWNQDPDSPYRSWIHHNFHSQYNTLIIENVMGITPRDDKVIELNPIDVGLDSFKLSNLRYHGMDIAVTLDETGYKLFADGQLVAHVDRLCHLKWDSATGNVEIADDSGAAVAAHSPLKSFKTAYDISYNEGVTGSIIEAVSNYNTGDTVVPKDSIPAQDPPEHQASYKLKTSDGSDWEENFNLDFGDYSGDQYKRAQMFVAQNGGIMSGVQVMIRNKDAKKDVTVELYESDAAGRPGKLLAGTTIPVSQVPVSEMEILTAKLNYKLEKGKRYYIVVGQAKGGSGIYCWALSARNMTAGTQAYQEGYGGSLDMYKLERGGNMLRESSLGDFYLEVFYKLTDSSSLQSAVSNAQNVKLPANLPWKYKAELSAALAAAGELLKNPKATQEELDCAELRLNNAVKAAAGYRAPAVKSGFIKGNDGKYYYWRGNALVKNSWVKADGKVYRTDKSGAKLTSSRVLKVGKKSFILIKGVRQQGTKWVALNRRVYRIKNGAVVVSAKAKIIKIGKKQYILNKDGVRQQNGIKKANKKLYYVNRSGIIKKSGWIKHKKKYYYAQKKHNLAVKKTIVIKGRKYKFDKKGVCRNKTVR